MKLELELSIVFDKRVLTVLQEIQRSLSQLTKEVHMNQTETKAALEAIQAGIADATAQLSKGIGEVEGEVQGLKDQIANAGQNTPEVDALLQSLSDKVGALKTSTQALDDLNPDAPDAGAPDAGSPAG